MIKGVFKNGFIYSAVIDSDLNRCWVNKVNPRDKIALHIELEYTSNLNIDDVLSLGMNLIDNGDANIEEYENCLAM